MNESHFSSIFDDEDYFIEEEEGCIFEREPEGVIDQEEAVFPADVF